jgi:ubiquinol-cytochrome c reductase cytochrome c subunit
VKVRHRRHRNASPRERLVLVHAGDESPIRALGRWICVLAMIGGAVVAFGGAPGPETDGTAGSSTVSDAADAMGPAAALYTQSCASCHGTQAEGSAAGPSLVGVGAASVDFYLRTGRMPLGAPDQRPVRQEPIFNEDEISALVDYVAGFGEGPAIPTVRGGGDVGRGYRLYTANCAACHAATGAGNAVGGGFAAVGLGNATDREIAEAVIVGPGVMPPFAFADEDTEALIAYIRYLRGAPAPGGAPIGGTGPVAEGFVAIVIGLVGLVLIARFAGSHRPGPEDDPDGGAGGGMSPVGGVDT